MERVRRWHRQRFGQIPEQFMQIAHNREDRKHLLCRSWMLSPVSSAEGKLGDLLSGTEAVVNSAASKALLPELRVDAATKIRLQIGARLPGPFIDGEICRDREGWHNTTECKAALTVRSQVMAIPFSGTLSLFLSLRQRRRSPLQYSLCSYDSIQKQSRAREFHIYSLAKRISITYMRVE